jgi:hypothetical protein
MPDGVDVDEFALYLQDSYATGGRAWVTFDYPNDSLKQVRLLFGPGIPAGFVMDEPLAGAGDTREPLIEPVNESSV